MLLNNVTGIEPDTRLSVIVDVFRTEGASKGYNDPSLTAVIFSVVFIKCGTEKRKLSSLTLASC